MSAPASVNESQNSDGYRRAWDALARMISDGRSLSGRERNCCFLNTKNQRFANVSAVTGFDFPDDTRGVSVSDWDQDGDLDVWMTNRTAPRIRFLRNDYAAAQNSVLLKLQGTKSNRDGIGTRVEIDLGSGKQKLVKTLRAGEGYLGQSSKRLHFGLGDAQNIVQTSVIWPNGNRELFEGIKPGGRYTLIEGSGAARVQPVRKSTLLAVDSTETTASDNTVAKSDGTVRIVLPARLPMPSLTYRGFDGKDASIRDNSKPMLLNLWATSCQPCIAEIREWSKHIDDFVAAETDVVLLCVDESDLGGAESQTATESVAKLLEQLGVAGVEPFSCGFATPDLLDALDITQQVLTKRTQPMPVPTSFLVDSDGRLAVVYKGPVDVQQILVDISQLSSPVTKHRDLAAAFPGTWYTNPFPPDLMAIPRRFQEVERPDRAFRYLKRHARSNDTVSQSGKPVVTSTSLSNKDLAALYIQLAKELQGQGKQEETIEPLELAAQLQPNDPRPRMALAMIFQQTGRATDVVNQYRKILSRSPRDPVISNNLAWVLATSADPQVRKPEEAIRLADFVCEKSHRKLPSALDTLAAAFAAAGRFPQAVSTVDEAIGLLESVKPEQRTDAQERQLLGLNSRRKLYQNQTPFVDQ